MSTVERFTHPKGTEDNEPVAPGENVAKKPRPRPVKSRTRRFEIGFFARKILNGWIHYYRLFPPRRAASSREQPARPPAAPDQAPTALAMMAGGDLLGDGVEQQGTPPMGNGDGGPVGGTSYEFGFMLSSTTEETGGDDGGA
jgi:hypothetical protein